MTDIRAVLQEALGTSGDPAKAEALALLDDIFQGGLKSLEMVRQTERLTELWRHQPTDPDLAFACAVVAMAAGNQPAAGMLGRLAATHGPDRYGRLAAALLPPPPFDMVSLEEAARACFAQYGRLMQAGRHDEADAYLQMANALDKPLLSPLPGLAELKAEAASIGADECRRRVMESVAGQRTKWAGAGDDIFGMWRGDPDELNPFLLRLAHLVLELAAGLPGTPTVLELGCFTGDWIEHLRRLGQGRIRACGLDLNRRAVEEARRRFPQVTFACGTAADLASGRSPFHVPPDIVVLSGVAMLMTAEELDGLARSLRAAGASRLVIQDQIANLAGDQALLRRGVSQVMHPYAKALPAAGWIIDSIDLPSKPSRSFTGIIVARPGAP